MNILGLSAFYHDSAAAFLRDGRIIAAAQEERFSRRRHDAGFPENAVQYCLREAGCPLTDVDAVVFYDKPLLKFDRLIETSLSTAPKGFSTFLAAMPVWAKEKLFLKAELRKRLRKTCGGKNPPPLLFTEHHQSHAASAFFPSPFPQAAVLCMDGVGEWATTTVWDGDGHQLRPLWEIRFPHSLGMLYSAFTFHAGFKVNSGEYKLMGLAPYGRPVYAEKIFREIVDVKEDGTFRMNMDVFGYLTDLTMTNSRFDSLFGGPPRKPESPITQREKDLAASIQQVTEEIVLRLGRTIYRETGRSNLCMAGGVALNCVANGRLLREGPFENIWIQPAAGDAGGAVGAALAAWHQHFDHPRTNIADHMNGAYLGPSFTSDMVSAALRSLGAVSTIQPDGDLEKHVASLLNKGAVIGWFSGRMEFGPRALGARSILGDPRDPRMQSTMNLKIKFRESFRPFAPAVLAEDVEEFFELDQESPYMLLVAKTRGDRALPAVTHVDGTARIQTVHAETNPAFHRLISEFKKLSGCSVLVNTSFNVRGEPIVCTPEDAYRCFMRTEMDYLVIENHLLDKKEQPPFRDNGEWRRGFDLD